MKTRTKLNKLSLICLAALCTTSSSLACKYKQLSLKENAERAPTVFVARAETTSNGMSGQGPDVPASMRVLRVIKGSIKESQLVKVYTSNSSCGLSIQAGQTWLILAGGDPLRTDQPSGSLLLADQAIRKLISNELGVQVEGLDPHAIGIAD